MTVDDINESFGGEIPPEAITEVLELLLSLIDPVDLALFSAPVDDELETTDRTRRRCSRISDPDADVLFRADPHQLTSNSRFTRCAPTSSVDDLDQRTKSLVD
jgi:hypothetical protein